MLKLRHISKLNDWVSIRMGKALNNSKMAGLVLGFVNGLVPCGLVYAAAIGAAATQSYTGGVVFMLMFGLGTIPALSIAGLSRWLIPLKRMRNLGVWKQIPMLILGLWLLLKGLGLGIPYISPDLGSHKPNANCCERHTEKH
jgi:sulfite exporter TauE/SafE